MNGINSNDQEPKVNPEEILQTNTSRKRSNSHFQLRVINEDIERVRNERISKYRAPGEEDEG